MFFQNQGTEKNNTQPDVRMPDNTPNEEHNSPEGENMVFNMSKFLANVVYPATKEDIIDYATDSGVGAVVLDMLERLPDTTFNNPADVSQALDENSNVVI